MATTLDCFQRVGKQPNFSVWLNNRVTDGAIEEAVALSMQAEILSGPLALDTSRLLRSWRTSSSEHKISSGNCPTFSSRSMSEKSRGGVE